MISLALGSGRMVADLELTTSTTEHMAGIDTAPFLRYLETSFMENIGTVDSDKPTTGYLSAPRTLGISEVVVECAALGRSACAGPLPANFS